MKHGILLPAFSLGINNHHHETRRFQAKTPRTREGAPRGGSILVEWPGRGGYRDAGGVSSDGDASAAEPRVEAGNGFGAVSEGTVL